MSKYGIVTFMDEISKKAGGYFVISIDFELFWGMFDKATLSTYGDRVTGERTAIPRMLEMFSDYGIHATWATVGMLMARNKKELISLLPPEHLRPRYSDTRMSAYHYLATAKIGESEMTDIFHFGNDLVQKIIQTPYQELGNHTFSHFYCIDGRHNEPSVFEADLDAHARVSATYNIQTTSIVFPRNQTSDQSLRTCAKKGILAYRGTELHPLYTPREDAKQSLPMRLIRLVDHYINISGYHTYALPKYISGRPINIPSSRFFRPWSKTLSFFESLKVRRITNAMTHAAKRGEVFHLWWHPHNFGIDQVENFTNLKKVIEHYLILKKEYGMESVSMQELGERCIEAHRAQAKS